MLLEFFRGHAGSIMSTPVVIPARIEINVVIFLVSRPESASFTMRDNL